MKKREELAMRSIEDLEEVTIMRNEKEGGVELGVGLIIWLCLGTHPSAAAASADAVHKQTEATA